LILSAEKLDVIDRCEKRSAFERRWKARVISPMGLLYKAVEAGVIGNGEKDAKDEVMKVAAKMEIASPDLNPYALARHIGSLGGMVAEAIKGERGEVVPVGAVKLASGDGWKSGLFRGGKGLMKIVLLAHWDDDALRAVAHSWGVVGELVAVREPIELVIAVVGPQRAGKRHSAWTKGYLHPQNHVLRFARRQGKESGFSSGWVEVWREMREDISTGEWMKQMKVDGVMDKLLVGRGVKFNPDDNRMKVAEREMMVLAERMEAVTINSPMHRSACDQIGRGACPWQACCFAPVETSPDRLSHLFEVREG
jgi:hypothetical protein